MINGALLRLLYEAASIQRWNDHIRPSQGFTELDKQAHKMVYAYVLAKYEEEERGAPVNYIRLIEGGLAEFLHRVKLTDIKPAIYHRLMKERGPDLNKWVLEQLSDALEDIGPEFPDKFIRYHQEQSMWPLERRILRASHYLATNWEFQIVYHLNQSLYGLEQTREEVENELESHSGLAGVQKLSLKKKTSHFLDLAGQLRFQQRWAHSPRVPQTSVLGHMLIVAMLAYICSVQVKACPRRTYNNYFGGLFHDLPELLTRDIVSPVKKSVEGLEEIVKDIERKQVEEKLLPLLPVSWHKEILYFVQDEFSNKILKDDEITMNDDNDIIIGDRITVDRETKTSEKGPLTRRYNEDEYWPYDGDLVKACDDLAAYMEVLLSIEHGTKSHHLEDGKSTVEEKYRHAVIQGIDFGEIIRSASSSTRQGPELADQ